VYDAASDHFQLEALSFWDRAGHDTVQRLELAQGSQVLDLCSGAGASALPAARVVGPAGHVLAVDVAERLLAAVSQRAASEGLINLEVRNADATAPVGWPTPFDAVVCVFGVFFAADPTAFVRVMASQLRPGGAVAVTTWGPSLFEPGNSIFWEEVARLRPELHRAYNPWDDLVTVGQVETLLAAGGLHQVHADLVPGEQPLDDPSAFWDVVLGSGLRGTVDQLDTEQAEHLRTTVVERLGRLGARSITTSVIFGTGTRSD
jgi:ubiquinone/menaquinone biosynthesis C-methylase UbiE